ncbi:MAG: class I mannose-6-phosphate isomerase [Oscillospiraceae bacterium]|nr:class I mannose-6-phosphate isomerase [Oscillospiraceae bacterium]
MPLLLTPAFKDYIWGGTKLRSIFNKKCDLEKVAESWELSCHKDGNSVISNGEYAGKTLSEYIKIHGSSVLGKNCERFENFPVLIKLIDAKDNLSVQVHPDNEYALRVEGEYGKTEMWYIVDCEEDASLLYGFKKEISKEEFSQRIKDNTLLEVTQSVKVNKGDVFFIEAGTLHAIGKGILIAEIQQNSNTTYRIYDYNRKDKDGNSRELHIDKACDVTSLCPATHSSCSEFSQQKGYRIKQLASCDYFTVHIIETESYASLYVSEDSFEHILILEGSCVLGSDNYKDMRLEKGDSVFIPAGYGDFYIDGKCTFIKTKV